MIFEIDEHAKLEIFGDIEDLPDLVELALDMHKESPFKDYAFDEQATADTFKNNMTIMYTFDDFIKGYLVCKVIPHPFFSELRTAVEVAWYVDPDYRGKHPGVLLDAFEEYAKSQGAHIATLCHFNTPALDRVYQARGFKSVEQSYIKDLR